ncbi:hypothetical protein D3C77_742350 [compost metagenome]
MKPVAPVMLTVPCAGGVTTARLVVGPPLRLALIVLAPLLAARVWLILAATGACWPTTKE